MEISKKRIFSLAILPVAVLLLSGCGKQTAPKTTSQAPATTNQPAPTTVTTPPQRPQTPGANAPETLPPLPADDKQAIDSELTNIDNDLKTTDGAFKSTDLSNANLGL